jgi:hypothetical protein
MARTPYEYVRADSQTALRLLRAEGGIVLWHDYGAWHGVTRALNELYATDARCGNLFHIRGTTLACLITGTAERCLPCHEPAP